MGRLDGQVAIVTGGGSGIGREAAKMLAAEGAHVVVAGRRKEPLTQVVGEIQRAGGKAMARQADVGKHTEAVALARLTVDTLGRVDILVNNAGHSSKARSIRWVGKPEWDSVLDVNLNGVYALTQAVLPDMLARGGGTIVPASSDATFTLIEGARTVAMPEAQGLELVARAEAEGRPVALDRDEHAAYLGVAARERARALASLEAPDFTLPDLAGRLHSLAEHRGKKVLLVAYASW